MNFINLFKNWLLELYILIPYFKFCFPYLTYKPRKNPKKFNFCIFLDHLSTVLDKHNSTLMLPKSFIFQVNTGLLYSSCQYSYGYICKHIHTSNTNPQTHKNVCFRFIHMHTHTHTYMSCVLVRVRVRGINAICPGGVYSCCKLCKWA